MQNCLNGAANCPGPIATIANCWMQQGCSVLHKRRKRSWKGCMRWMTLRIDLLKKFYGVTEFNSIYDFRTGSFHTYGAE